ncbi:MAG TPA: SRPBCC domain-containing protein [Candidatus Eremiobacteraceae bacterium]|nr:SRPBCC domain-containing protein [Candidatus Eremiobacteraceae bacterium]
MIETDRKNLNVDQTVRVEAPMTEVFKLITEPDQIRRWQPVQIFEPHVGGRYHMYHGDHGSIGRIIEIDPPRSVSFTWDYEDAPIGAETIVKFELKQDGAATLVHLTHTGFTSSETAKGHGDGWAHYLSRLKTVAAGGDPGPDTSNCAAPAIAERAASPDYSREMPLEVSRERAFEAIATIDGLRKWWTKATGSASVGGEIRFIFYEDESVTMRVDESTRPSRVSWTCVGQCHDGAQNGEWVGTSVTFDLIERSPEACTLRFRHSGLTPKLECFGQCERGWNFYLASLAGLLERGKGQPHAA